MWSAALPVKINRFMIYNRFIRECHSQKLSLWHIWKAKKDIKKTKRKIKGISPNPHVYILHIWSLFCHYFAQPPPYRRCRKVMHVYVITCSFSTQNKWFGCLLWSSLDPPCPLPRWTHLLFHQRPMSLRPPQCGWLTRGTGRSLGACWVWMEERGTLSVRPALGQQNLHSWLDLCTSQTHIQWPELNWT